MKEMKMEKDLHLINEFIQEGQENGTLVEAIYWALTSALHHEVDSIEQALDQAAGEWYK